MKTCLLILVLLLVISACGTRTDSSSVFNTDKPYQTPNFSIAAYKSPELRSQDQQRDIAVAVAMSGGGHRAGNYGIGVFKQLEQLSCQGETLNALKEIDYLSTVSGGGLAAGVYISTLFDHLQNEPQNTYSLNRIIDNNQHDITRNLERGYHNILARALVSVRSIFNSDRGDFLERRFDINLLGSERRARSLTLGDVFVPAESAAEITPILPMWVANATIYENGSIFPFHPLALNTYAITAYTHHLQETKLSDYYSLPLSIGMKASASFPGAVPATTLSSSYDPENPFLHLFDGGLADNLGVYTAFKMLSEQPQKAKVLIIIDAYNSQPEPFSSDQGSPTITEIILRTTGISLDAWRIRHRLLIEQLSTSGDFGDNNLKVIYLAFDDLESGLKEKVNKIGTNFNISEGQQAILFDAAKMVISTKKEEIVQAVFGKSCSDKN